MGLGGPSRRGLSNATRHYRSLFTLPPGPAILALHLAVAVLFGLTLSFRAESLLFGLLWMALPSFGADAVTVLFVEKDRILTSKRILTLSFFGNLFWLFCVSIGRAVAISGLPGEVFAIAYAMGFSIAASLRLMVLRCVSAMHAPRAILLSLVQPCLCVAVTWLSQALELRTVVYVLASLPLMMVSIWVFLRRVDSVAESPLGHGSLELFRAFALNWMEDEGAPLEEVLASMAMPGEARVGVVTFSSDRGCALMVIPYVHAGPFKNIGSSRLTSLIHQRTCEVVGSSVAVFHGTCGHERDVATDLETRRIVDSLETSSGVCGKQLEATPMVNLTEYGAKVTCQRLNNIAIITVTLAPSDMEDLPESLGDAVTSYGRSLGFDAVFVIDAHNSIGATEPAPSHDDVEAALTACKAALRKVKEQPLLPATVGAFSLAPEEFTVEQGMGSGGIAAVVVTVAGQTAGYLALDGNNLVTDLRAKILRRLEQLGVDTGEVCTSDTHEVNATVTGRGYHPLGEALDQEAFLEHVTETVTTALAQREPAFLAWKDVRVGNVRFVGDRNVNLFTAVTDAAITEAKRAALSLFPVTALATLALLLSLRF